MMKAQKIFSGFEDENIPTIGIPRLFIEELMWEIEDVNELKLLLKVFRDLAAQDGQFHYLTLDDLLQDLRESQFGENISTDIKQFILATLQRWASRGILLIGNSLDESQEKQWIFLNTPMGRAAVTAIANGQWKEAQRLQHAETSPTLPNIYNLYEQHIGLLTPMIAETLQDAEQTYPHSWIEEAIRLAVENNKRSWRYVEAILKRWKEEGKGERKTGQNSEEALRKYAEQWKKPSVSRRNK
ncbi:MAG: DnaD domain-containing protein [Anaerolineales bacterium]